MAGAEANNGSRANAVADDRGENPRIDSNAFAKANNFSSADAGATNLSSARAEAVSVPWHHLWRPTGYRSSRWHVLVGEHRSPGKGG